MLIPIRFEREGREVPAAMAASFQSELKNLDERAWFTERERDFIGHFRYPARRESFVLGRVAAKRAVLGVEGELKEPGSFEVGKGVFEQPLLTPNKLELSIAHSSGAAVAIACGLGHPVGIDLELFARASSDVLAESFTPREKELLRGMRGGVDKNYLMGWSIKEALAKALRCGLMTPFPILEFSPIAELGDGGLEVEFPNFGQFKAFAWTLDAFVLALAIPKKTNASIEPRSWAEFRKRLVGR